MEQPVRKEPLYSLMKEYKGKVIPGPWEDFRIFARTHEEAAHKFVRGVCLDDFHGGQIPSFVYPVSICLFNDDADVKRFDVEVVRTVATHAVEIT